MKLLFMHQGRLTESGEHYDSTRYYLAFWVYRPCTYTDDEYMDEVFSLPKNWLAV